MILNGAMAVILRYSTKFSSFGTNYVKVIEDTRALCDKNVVQRIWESEVLPAGGPHGRRLSPFLSARLASRGVRGYSPAFAGTKLYCPERHTGVSCLPKATAHCAMVLRQDSNPRPSRKSDALPIALQRI